MNIETEVPSPYVEVQFSGGCAYLNPETDDELEAEGFAREITRRIQELRKSAGLKKDESVRLAVVCDNQLAAMLAGWVDSIKSKVGAAEIDISNEKPSGKYEHAAEESVKNKTFSILMKK